MIVVLYVKLWAQFKEKYRYFVETAGCARPPQFYTACNVCKKGTESAKRAPSSVFTSRIKQQPFDFFFFLTDSEVNLGVFECGY